MHALSLRPYLCAQVDEEGKPKQDKVGKPETLKLEKTDFLAQGQDKNGKGDYQGCGEFNPILLFSQEEEKAFQQHKDKTKRNEANEPNRRVMVLIFRKGTKVDPNRWPCPRAKEGTGGCEKRFWSDGEKRRATKLVDKPRKFEETKDTFACRFYDRMMSKSPCEHRLPLELLRIRLFDPMTERIPNVLYRLNLRNRIIEARANEEGYLLVRLGQLPEDCVVEWGEPDESGKYNYSQKIFLKFSEVSDEEAVRRQLHNLGYLESKDFGESIKSFQEDYGFAITGKFEDVKQVLRDWHDDPQRIQRRQNIP